MHKIQQRHTLLCRILIYIYIFIPYNISIIHIGFESENNKHHNTRLYIIAQHTYHTNAFPSTYYYYCHNVFIDPQHTQQQQQQQDGS